MESKIPLPTDNIYKFYALFGLLLIISSLFCTAWVIVYSLDKLGSYESEHESLQGIEEEKDKNSKEQKLSLRMSIDILFLKILRCLLPSLLIIGYACSCFGFYVWHKKVQPKQDEYLDLQIKILKKELASTN